MLKAGGNTGQRQGQETEAKPVFPPLRPMAAEAVEEEEISCVSGEGLAFAEASLIYRNLLRFGSQAASSKIAALPNFALVKGIDRKLFFCRLPF